MARPPRDAATVILVRPTPDGRYEVLLTRRPETMRFMGGAYVFPGGALDPGDSSDDMAAVSALTAQAAAALLDETVDPVLAHGLFCCALRELFEEVGVLIARTAGGSPVAPEVVRDRYAPRQSELGHEPGTFAKFLSSEGLVLATDVLVPHARLVTPEISPIRFDARFFVAPMPSGQVLVPDPNEVPEAVWLSPAEALRLAAEEGLPVPIPTMAVLQGLAEVESYDELLAGGRVTMDIHAAKLSPHVSHVLAPNPGLATGPGTNTYVVGNGECVIVDPAVDDARYLDVLLREAGSKGRPALVALTHLHPDHTGGADILRRQLGCPVAVWGKALDQAPFADMPLEHGQTLKAGDTSLRVHYTPGHASHHVCLEVVEEESLIAGDVVSGLGTVVISPPDGNMADYLATLDHLLSLNVRRIYPGHGPVVEDGPRKLTEYVQHRREREAQVVAAMEAGLDTIPAMVGRIYADVSPSLHSMAERSVLAHLELLESSGRARRSGDSWTLLG